MTTILIIDQIKKDRIIAEAVLGSSYNIKSFSCPCSVISSLGNLDCFKVAVILADAKTVNCNDDLEAIKKMLPAACLVLADSQKNIENNDKNTCFRKQEQEYYVCKPYISTALLKTIRQASSAHLAKRELLCHSLPSGGALIAPDIIGSGQLFDKLRERINLYAGSSAPVLILGESGTGKELAASAIHKYSGRNSKKYIPIDCAAMPKELVESNLFGTTRGAYTDATDKKGAFEAAKGGTVFLDEIAELQQEMQAKFLRVLESKKGCRLGSHEQHSYDFRLVSATNSNLYGNKNFRPELLHRINTLVLRMPPLREHKCDIADLADLFIHKSGKTKEMDVQALKKLESWDWPGNVRELRNIVKRAIVLSAKEKVIRSSHIEIDRQETYRQGSLF
ncbi:sigma-54 dependent transcriptional regulator [Spirochaetota bacterium]